MVARPTDTPVEVTERLADAKKKVEELTRSVGRGTAALRDATGNVVELINSDVPLLSAHATNVGIQFDNDQMLVVSADGSEWSTLKSGALSAVGNVEAEGNMYAYEMWASRGMRVTGGGISCTDNITADLRVSANNLMITGNSIFSRDRDGAMRWNSLGDFEFCNRAGSGYRDIYYWIARPQAPSWRSLKTDMRSFEAYVGESAKEVINRLDIQAWRYNSDDIHDEDTHLGPMLDEMPSELIVRKYNDNGQDRSTYDRDGLVATIIQAYQELSNDYDALESKHDAYVEQKERELFDLRCDVDDLKESVRIINEKVRLN